MVKKRNINLIGFLFLGFQFIILFWGINKGIDLSDEGYYAQNFVKNQSVGINFINFGILLKNFDLNIITLRLIRLFGTISSFLFLFFALKKSDKFKFVSQEIFLLFSSSILVSFFFGPTTLGYNSMVGIFSAISIGLILLSQKRELSVYFILSGFFTYLVFITKFTSVVILFIYVIAFICINFNSKVKNILYFLFGIIIGIFLIKIFCDYSLFDILGNIKETNEILVVQDYSSNYQINLIFDAIISILKILFIVFVFIFPVLKSKRSFLKSTFFWSIYILFVNLVVVSFFYYQYLLNLDISQLKTQLIQLSNIIPRGLIVLVNIIIVFVTILLNYDKKQFFDKNVYNSFLFILIPFGLSSGSNNSYFTMICFYFPYFIVAFHFLLIGLKEDANLTQTIRGKIISNYFLVSFLFILYYVGTPYLKLQLWKHTETTNIDRLKGIKVDKQTKSYIEEVQNILIKNNFKKSDYIFGINRIPMTVYLMGGLMPGIINWGEPSNVLTIASIKKEPLDPSKKIFFLICETPTDEFLSGLKEVGIDFSTFKCVGSVFEDWGDVNVKVYTQM